MQYYFAWKMKFKLKTLLKSVNMLFMQRSGMKFTQLELICEFAAVCSRDHHPLCARQMRKSKYQAHMGTVYYKQYLNHRQ